MASIEKEYLRNEVKRFEEFVSDEFKYEVLISYDCAGIHKPYRKELVDFLTKTYGIEFKNESLYSLSVKLNQDEIELLRKKIETLFNEIVLNEAVIHDKITTVLIIYPSMGKFNYLKMVKEPKL